MSLLLQLSLAVSACSNETRLSMKEITPDLSLYPFGETYYFLVETIKLPTSLASLFDAKLKNIGAVKSLK